MLQPGTAGCTSGHGKPSTVLFDTQAPDVFMQKRPTLQEILPKSGLIVSEKGGLTELLCKPKIMPLKSITLQKLEEMEVCGCAWTCAVTVL